MSVHVFGIRHHGPGSARSLRAALTALGPDIVLVEGPPDADALVPLAAHADMKPPVALLIYDPAEPRRAVYYPFATFSPEWQALLYALGTSVPVRFIDLPQTHQFALERAGEQRPQTAEAPESPTEASAAGTAPGVEPPGPPAAGGTAPAPASPGTDSPGAHSDTEEPPEATASTAATADDDAPATDAPNAPGASAPDAPAASAGAAPARIRQDPLEWLARAAGYGDGERWWEDLVEQRRSDEGVFDAILEAMTAVRQGLALPPDEEETRREAYMRQQMRAAEREGRQRIAVVCGAWHAPALTQMPTARADAQLLKGLPKAKVAVTWVPWTYGRLALASGYGAGIRSPGWYEHVWHAADAPPEQLAAGWMTRVSRLLRAEDLDASPAQAVDATRLAEALAAFRGLALPGLAELNEAAEAVFWSGAGGAAGSSLQLRLIEERLIVGDRLGEVPAEAPAVPLQQDLAREQKRLRLPPEAAERALELDLRKPNDLDRSRLLHRLSLLGIPWGRAERVQGAKGTFREAWRLRWQPEFAVAVIEASIWGNTVAEAATGRVRDTADRTGELPALTAALEAVLLADLPAAADHLIARIQSEAALASDTTHLMRALPPLANVLRYGSVRGADAEALARVVDGLLARIGVGLAPACASLDDDAAAAMVQALEGVHGAVTLLEQPTRRAEWLATLARLLDQQGVHGLVVGRIARMLLDAGALEPPEATRRMGLALSRAVPAEAAGAWVEGFLRGSGLVLLHDRALWNVLDRWVADLPGDAFTPLLPLLRRTFAEFPAGERRMIGQLAASAEETGHAAASGAKGFDAERAASALPLLAALLGVNLEAPEASA